MAAIHVGWDTLNQVGWDTLNHIDWDTLNHVIWDTMQCYVFCRETLGNFEKYLMGSQVRCRKNPLGSVGQ